MTPTARSADDAVTRALPALTVRSQRRSAAHDLDGALEDLGRAVELARGSLDPAALDPADAVLARAGQRRALAPGATVVALLGATGSGKSSLFNAVVGADLARTAVTRPTTTRPLAALPPAGAGASSARLAELLDWLEVDERVQLDRDPGTGASTVLLDLPDVDSDSPEHRRTASRLAGLVDVIVWVLDPEKYADAVLHRDFIVPMAEHAAVTVVALNQIDRLDPLSRQAVTADLSQLLAQEGFPGVTVAQVSARTGEGVDALRARVGEVARTAHAAEMRLAADVRTVAQGLWTRLGLDEAAGTAVVRHQVERANQDLQAAAARAAGVPAVTDAVASSLRHRAAARVGWVPLRWLGRFRRDPLRALHLGADAVRGRTSGELDAGAPGSAAPGSVAAEAPVARTSLPAAGPGAAGALRTASHALAVRLAAGLPGDAAAEVVERSDERASSMSDELDAAVARTDLEQTVRPRWWSAANALQWLLALTAVVGGVWLLVLQVMRRYLLIDVDPPRWGEVPWPTLLLLAGLVLGLLAALLGALLARVGAARRAHRASRRLCAATDEVVATRLVEPLRADLSRWNDLVDTLERLR